MPHQNSASNNPHILIIDDDATIRLLMRDSLAESKYRITEASNGMDALDIMAKDRPSLVLLDVKMPGIDGFDVCNQIRSLYGDTDISIVMVTGLDDSPSIEKGYALGATDFIVKPINWDTFPYRIQYLIKARNAIIETNYRELHLQHVEGVSRILTQNKNKNKIVREVLTSLLDIFSADRAFIIKPALPSNNFLHIENEATSKDTYSIRDMQDSLFDALGSYTFHRANHSEYPVVSIFDESNPAPLYDASLKQQMIKALPLQKDKNWYLVIQQCSTGSEWSTFDEETFYKISTRLTGVLSRYLLTEKLHVSERLLRQAQKIGHLGNWNWDAKSNQFSISEEIHHIYSQPVDRWQPECDDFFQIKYEEDVQRLNLFKNILNNSNKSYQIDHRVTTSSKNIRWVREQAAGSYNEQGELIEVNGTVQDITQAHYKKEQEVHNNKMDAIGQLTSGVAHDFGNLMTVARGNLELLKESMAMNNNASQDQFELIEDAYSAVEDSVELTKQLLAFSRKKSIAPIVVNIEATIKKFHKLFNNTVGKSIELNINVQKDLPNILVDPTQFESALLNIIINARNAMPEGGSLTVNAEQMATQKSHELIRNTDNDLGDQCICIFIKDDGLGMTQEVLDRAIEPFYTTSKTSGTGLGLSMVYGFIKQSGGDLLIHSKPARGTTIYLQFPLYENLIIEKSKVEKIASLTETKATILIVEDQATVRQFAVRCLNQPGIKILQAENADEARTLLDNNKSIDLLFTDVLMPGEMNGHDLASWTNKKYPNIKILLTTAMENRPNATQPNRNHDFQMLAKPYNRNELKKYIYHTLE